jgi:hypothetical protein
LGPHRTHSQFCPRRYGRGLSLEALEQILERNGAIEKGHPYEKHLDQELLLRALFERRLERVDGADHSQQIAGGEAIAAFPKGSRSRSRNSLGFPVQDDSELGAEDVSEAREKDAEVDARVGQFVYGVENLSRAMAGDDIDDSKKLILRNEAQSFAYALGGHRPFADRYHLIGEA